MVAERLLRAPRRVVDFVAGIDQLELKAEQLGEAVRVVLDNLQSTACAQPPDEACNDPIALGGTRLSA